MKEYIRCKIIRAEKRLLLLLLLFVTFQGVMAQQYKVPTDLLDSIQTEFYIDYDIDSASASLFVYSDTIKPSSPDTIRALFLVCDTSKYDVVMITGVDEKRSGHSDYRVLWQRGYFVIENWSTLCINEHKERFDDNIVIWDYKMLE